MNKKVSKNEIEEAIKICEKLTQQYFEQSNQDIKMQIKKAITQAYLTIMIDGDDAE